MCLRVEEQLRVLRGMVPRCAPVPFYLREGQITTGWEGTVTLGEGNLSSQSQREILPELLALQVSLLSK